MLVLGSCNHTYTDIQWYCMLSTKPCVHQIAKFYNMILAAYGFFDLLRLDMFLNPTNIEPARAAVNKSLLYTTESEVSAEFHGLPQMNPSFVLLNVGYPINFYWGKLCNAFRFDYVFMSLHIHFTNVLSLRTGLYRFM